MSLNVMRSVIAFQCSLNEKLIHFGCTTNTKHQSLVTGAMALWLERRFGVGTPGVYFPCRVIPEDFKKWYLQLPCLALST